MRFDKRSDALYYLKIHTKEFQKKLKIVKFNKWSCDLWKYVGYAYTVVMR